MFDYRRVKKTESSITYEDALGSQFSQLAQDLKIPKLPTGIGAGFEVKDPNGFTYQEDPAEFSVYSFDTYFRVWLVKVH